MTASPWSWQDITTLCVSVLALLMSAAALGWQVVSWRRSGARLRVVTAQGIVGSPPSGSWFFSVDISNTGRLATEVSGVGFQLARSDNRMQIVDILDVFGMQIALPQTLEPGASMSVRYAPERLAEVLRDQQLSGRRARPFANTGHGRTLGRRRRNIRTMAEALVKANRELRRQ